MPASAGTEQHRYEVHEPLSRAGIAIWIIFVVDFLVKLLLAPDRMRFLRRNLLTLVSLAIPALRMVRVLRLVRVLRAVRAARGLRLLRVITSLNRGMRALGLTLRRRGFGYVLLLTLLSSRPGHLRAR